MGNTATLAIRIISDAKSANAGIDQTTAKTSKMSKVGAAAGKVLAVGLAAGGVAAVKMAKAAADDAAAATQLANALKQGAGATDAQVASTERWITAQGKALGVSDDELRPALAKLARATGSVGKAQKLAALGMDIAAGSGKSLDSITSALAKAQTGSMTGLAKLGIATKDAAGNTRSLADIQAELAKKYKGAAKAAASTDAGKAKIMAVQFQELQEQIGAKLLPVMSKLVTVGLKVVDWISKNTTLAGILVGAIGGLLAVTYTVSKAMAVWSAVTKIATGVQAAFNFVMAANPIGLVVLAIVALVAAIIILWKKSDTFRKIVTGAWNAVKHATVAVWNAIKNALAAAWKFILKVATTYVRGVLKGVSVVWNAIKKATSAVWNGIKWYFKAVWTGIKTVATTYVKVVKAVVTGVWDAIKRATGATWDTIKRVVSGAIGKVVDFVKGLKSKVTGVFNGAKDWLLDAGKKILQGLIDGIQAMVGKVKDQLGKVTGLIPDWKGPADKDRRLLYNAGQLIMGGLVEGMESQHTRIRRSLASTTSLIAGGVNPSLSGSGSGLGAFGAGTVTEIHHWTVQTLPGNEDATADTIQRMLDNRKRRRGVRG